MGYYSRNIVSHLIRMFPKISRRSLRKSGQSGEVITLKDRRFGSTARRRRRVTARVVVIIITVVIVIVVAGFTGMARAVELLVGDEGA